MTMVTAAHQAQPGEIASPAPVFTVQRYRLPAKVFHWVTAALVFVMVSSGVIAKQIWEGALADTLFSVHKLTGVTTLTIVLLRLGYRLIRRPLESGPRPRSRPLLHFALYAVIVTVPLLGWSGVSDGGGREIFPGFSLPMIWPEGAGYESTLLHLHAYIAFSLLALVALHIGVAMHDYMSNDHGTSSGK
jgi:cytochrome b561